MICLSLRKPTMLTCPYCNQELELPANMSMKDFDQGHLAHMVCVERTMEPVRAQIEKDRNTPIHQLKGWT